MKIINIAEEINPNLGMNYSAKKLFNKINSRYEKCFILNFENVIFMSRTFAQEYIYQKNKTNKKITEINKPSEISLMLDVVYRDYIKNNLIEVLYLEKEIYKKLGLKTSAKKLFEKINSMPNNIIILDFSNIEFMSRSFAQEYIYQKNMSPIEVKETNMNEIVKSMLDVASNDYY